MSLEIQCPFCGEKIKVIKKGKATMSLLIHKIKKHPEKIKIEKKDG